MKYIMGHYEVLWRCWEVLWRILWDIMKYYEGIIVYPSVHAPPRRPNAWWVGSPGVHLRLAGLPTWQAPARPTHTPQHHLHVQQKTCEEIQKIGGTLTFWVCQELHMLILVCGSAVKTTAVTAEL